MVNEPSIVWFDYETFGTHPAWDKPAQFAGLRTDLDLNPIADPCVLYCAMPGDYLPQPRACQITGLSPQEVNEKGSNEATFIRQVLAEIGRPGTCSAGYNSIRFDDEFTRHIAFRNFHDPYEYEWKSGNSRWDILDVVRLTRALRPDGINWPVNSSGGASNRLEHITAANGIEHSNAHDAMADVWATLKVARLIRQQQPRLYDFVFTHRDKQSAAQLLNTQQRQPCVYVSSTIAADRHHLAVVMPLALHASNRNSVIVFDLQFEPEKLLDLDADELERRIFARSDNTNKPERTGLSTIAINTCPVLVPLSALRDEDAERLGMDRQRIDEHAESCRRLFNEDRLNTIVQAMCKPWTESPFDLEATLYSGAFFGPDDKQRLNKIRTADANTLASFSGFFDDPRLDELLWRYRARNFPESLDADERRQWEQLIATRLTDDQAPWLSLDQFDEALAAVEWSDDEQALASALSDYADTLRNRIASTTA